MAIHIDPLSPSVDWNRIETFVGFGRRDAPVVFVGMEEGLHSDAVLQDELAIRSSYETPVMDLKAAYRDSTDVDRTFDPDHAPRQPTWRVMSDLMLRRDGVAHPHEDDRRRYRGLHLGRSDGDTLLMELLPYPHPAVSDWLYEPFGRYATRADYEADLLPKRKRLLRGVLAESPRELIVCFGKGQWPNFEELFDDVGWRDVGFSRVGAWKGSRVVLTTHFSHSDFDTDEQLSDFARIALGR